MGQDDAPSATTAGGEEHALQLVDGADGQTEPQRIGLAEEDDLLHMALDMRRTS